jgi:methylglutaconyl-CoA hydratase
MIVARQDGVLRLTFDRPEARNAVNAEVYSSLARELEAAASAREIRVVVLAGKGPAFCAGADVQHLRKVAAAGREASGADAKLAISTMFRLASLPKPTVAAVQGPAYGAGVGLVLACDIVVASENARFALSEVRIGLVPGLVAPMMADAIGRREARRYLLTGESFDAREALRIGLVHEVVPAEALDEAVSRQIEMLKQGGPQALAGTKKLLAAGYDDARLREIVQMAVEQRDTPEAREGMAAFLEKRKPSWPTEAA